MTKYSENLKESDVFRFQSMIAEPDLDFEALYRMLNQNICPEDPLSISIVENAPDHGFLKSFFEKMQENPKTIIFFINHYAIKLSKAITERKSVSDPFFTEQESIRAATLGTMHVFMGNTQRQCADSFCALFMLAYRDKIEKRTCALVNAINQIHQFLIQQNIGYNNRWRTENKSIENILINATDYLIPLQENAILDPIIEGRLRVYTTLSVMDNHGFTMPIEQAYKNFERLPYVEKKRFPLIQKILNEIKNSYIKTDNDIHDKQKIEQLFQGLEISIPGIIAQEKEAIRYWIDKQFTNRHYAVQVISELNTIPKEKFIDELAVKNSSWRIIENIATKECFSHQERRPDIVKIVTKWVAIVENQAMWLDCNELEKNISDYISANQEFKEEIDTLNNADRSALLRYMHKQAKKGAAIGALVNKADDAELPLTPKEMVIHLKEKFTLSPELSEFSDKNRDKVINLVANLARNARDERNTAISSRLKSAFESLNAHSVFNISTRHKYETQHYLNTKNDLKKELSEQKTLSPTIASTQKIKTLETILELIDWILITVMVESMYPNERSMKFTPVLMDMHMSVYPATEHLPFYIQKIISNIINEKVKMYIKFENLHEVFKELRETVLDDEGCRKLEKRLDDRIKTQENQMRHHEASDKVKTKCRCIVM